MHAAIAMGADRSEIITLIVGLGNPGREYEKTRHSVGFMVVDRLSEAYGVSLQERKFRAAWGSGSIEGNRIMLVKPLTFMNRSGEAVREIMDYFDTPPSQMLVVHDDLDLPCGRIKIVRGGGSGGHRGVASLGQHLGTNDFPRLKLGIGRPLHGEPVEAFVLQPPYAEERTLFEEMTVRGMQAVQAILAHGVAAASNTFNRKDPPGS